LPTRIVLSCLTYWVHAVKITMKPVWNEPAHVAPARHGQRAAPPTHT
jgi:hypothetical protein